MPPRPESGLRPSADGSYICEVVGAPMSFGQPLAGTERAPAALRSAGLRAAVEDLGWGYADAGDAPIPGPVPGPGPGPVLTPDASPAGGGAERKAPAASGAAVRVRNSREVGEGCEAVYARVRRAAEGGRFVLTVGGDHSVAAGSVQGVLAARPGAGVVWVDAHADINTPEVSPSGNLHGMPLALLMRLHMHMHHHHHHHHLLLEQQRQGGGGGSSAAAAGDAPGGGQGAGPGEEPLGRHSLGPGWDWQKGTPVLLPSRVVYIGLRDIDEGEKRLIRSLGIKAFTMSDIDRRGIGQVMELALSHLLVDDASASPAGGGGGRRRVLRPLHLSFDVDAVDPAVAPSTGTRVPGGLSYREAHYVCEVCAETGLLGSMDVVEVNPLLGVEEVGGGAGRRGAAALGLGGAARGGGGGGGRGEGRGTPQRRSGGREGPGDATVKAALGFIGSALGKSILGPGRLAD